MGGIGFIKGISVLGGLAVIFQLLVGIGGTLTFFNKMPWYILLTIILLFIGWLLKK